MWTMKILFLICDLCLLQLGAVGSAVVRGTTVGPGFTRISAEWPWKCPPKFLPVNNGQLCCGEPVRQDSCPGYPKNPLVQFEDDPVCCQDPKPEPCFFEKCNSHKVANIECPVEYPNPIAHGTRCCLYKTRSASCPTGSPGTPLEPSDPEECCSSSRLTECLNSWKKLNVIQWGICSKNVCEKSIYSSDPVIVYPPYDFRAENVFFETCELNKDGHYLPKSYEVNVGFVIDIGCVQVIKEVIIKNTRDYPDLKRATRGFRVDVSLDTQTWTEIVQSNLTSIFHLACEDIPLEVFPASTLVESRYLRFTTLDYYLHGGGINYLTWTSL